ncbi:membrane protein insertase YidC [Halofilum ochraceum]|uniref:membrane protein insertase YidC n=1 Tax=Halofilum ochraceum TaxID=1611323 RepID=UPI0008D9634D|nr:membrane protein insertase YidC [Halofilum ochraceum]
MDNQRLFLYGALGLLLLLIWQTWQVDYGPRREGTAPATAERSADGDGSATAPGDTPEGPVTADAGDDGTPSDASLDDAPGQAPIEKGRRIQVVTDRLDVTIDTRGGDLRQAFLRKYKAESGGDEPVELLTDTGGDLFVAQSGLQAGDQPAPTHHAEFRAEADEYRLAEGEDTLRVPLVWSGDGVRVTKTYTFHRDSYVVDVAFDVENTGDSPWVGRQYRQFQRYQIPSEEQPTLLPAFFGAAYYNSEDKYEQIALEDIAEEPMQKTFEGGWAAMVEHYFVTAWLPSEGETNTYYTKALTDGAQPRYLIGLYSTAKEAASGESISFSNRLYVGPKDTDYLAGLAEGLTLTIDYGYLAFLSEPLFWVLDWLHSYVGNWGFAIILLTLLIKLVFYKLSEKSYRSMAKMRKLQPKIQQLKDRYGDDRERMGRAMMDLYKTEKINPLGGCLPILVQIPVFIALYWMLLGTVELRHADFILWINDLSVRDPWFILPLLMGASMWAQQKLNPAPVDPMQQKIFAALPVVFTVFFMFFPAGLVLYWLTNNVLSIAQQYYITRHVVGDVPGRDKGKGKGTDKAEPEDDTQAEASEAIADQSGADQSGHRSDDSARDR